MKCLRLELKLEGSEGQSNSFQWVIYFFNIPQPHRGCAYDSGMKSACVCKERKIHTEGRSELPKRQKSDTPPEAGERRLAGCDREGADPAIASGCGARGHCPAPVPAPLRPLPPAAARDARPRRVCPSQLLLMSEPAPGSAGRQRNRAQPGLSRCGRAPSSRIPPGKRGGPAHPAPPRSRRGNLPNFSRPWSRHSLPWPPATLPATSRRRRLGTAQVRGAARAGGSAGLGVMGGG